MKRIFAGAIALCLLLSACTPLAQRRSITLTDGTQVMVPAAAQRLGAVYGPSYEALVALGAEEHIVACADVQWENFPWAKRIFQHISTLPYLENVHSAVNMEELMEQRPDLVFAFPRPNELRQLEAAGIAAVPGATSRTLDEVKEQLMVYAQALGGDAVAAAQAYADYFDEKRTLIRAVTDAIPVEERPKVYYAGVDMLTTYGTYSDLCELIEDAGGIAVGRGLAAGNRTQITFEELAAWDPEYIFIDHGGMNEKDTVEQVLAKTYQNGRYQAIDAVAQRRVYLSPSGVFYWDMGLQKILLLMYVAKTIHPEEFAWLDLKEELQTFYQTFFHYSLTGEEAQRILNREDP